MTSFEIQDGESGVSGIFTMKGELTVGHMEKVREALLSAMKKVEHLKLDLSAVTDVDISGLQIICSAHRTSLKQNKLLSFHSAVPGGFRSAAQEGGFARHKACRHEREECCMWITGGPSDE